MEVHGEHGRTHVTGTLKGNAVVWTYFYLVSGHNSGLHVEQEQKKEEGLKITL